jgi:hypothetical protein
MLPVIMAAGRALAAGGSRAVTSLKGLMPAGPRGANMFLEGGALGAGKSSPMDMLGNVANIAGVGMQGYEMFGGGGDKKPSTGSPKQKGIDGGID